MKRQRIALWSAVLAAVLSNVPWAESAPARWYSVRTARLEAWLPTLHCETRGMGWRGWWASTGNGYYGGLQFDHGTWAAHGGLRYGYNASNATPRQQVLVASRLRYDGWPNCPNPPRIR